jgi:nucleoid-associated protein YgaU
VPRQKNSNTNNTFKVRWGESYTSLFLGIVVVIVIAVLIFSFIKNGRQLESTQSSSTVSENQMVKPGFYVSKEGDSLWKISEKFYGSGYNWVDIVSANKIENPDVLFTGVKLLIPDVKVIKVETIQAATAPSIKGTAYTVKTGDNLWDIALRAYGDGYKWVELAKTNKLVNPDLIYEGNKIKIPR